MEKILFLLDVKLFFIPWGFETILVKGWLEIVEDKMLFCSLFYPPRSVIVLDPHYYVSTQKKTALMLDQRLELCYEGNRPGQTSRSGRGKTAKNNYLPLQLVCFLCPSQPTPFARFKY